MSEEEIKSKKQLSVKIDSEAYDKLWAIAHKRETSSYKVTVTDIVNEAIELYLQKEA